MKNVNARFILLISLAICFAIFSGISSGQAQIKPDSLPSCNSLLIEDIAAAIVEVRSLEAAGRLSEFSGLAAREELDERVRDLNRQYPKANIFDEVENAVNRLSDPALRAKRDEENRNQQTEEKGLFTRFDQSDVIINAGRAMYAVFSPDDRYILTAAASGNVKLWDAATGDFIKSFSEHDDLVTQAKFSVDGKYIVTASRDNKAILWDFETARPIQTYRGYNHGITAIDISPDNKFIATTSTDKTVKIWSLEKNEKPIKTLTGFKMSGIQVRFFSSMGRTFLTASSVNGDVYVYDTADWKKQPLLKSNPLVTKGFDIDATGTIISVVNSDGTITIKNLSDEDQSPNTLLPPGKDLSLEYTDVSPDRSHAVTIISTIHNTNEHFRLGDILLWDLNSNLVIQALRIELRENNSGFRWGINSARFNNDGTKIVVAANNGSVAVFTIREEGGP